MVPAAPPTGGQGCLQQAQIQTYKSASASPTLRTKGDFADVSTQAHLGLIYPTLFGTFCTLPECMHSPSPGCSTQTASSKRAHSATLPLSGLFSSETHGNVSLGRWGACFIWAVTATALTCSAMLHSMGAIRAAPVQEAREQHGRTRSKGKEGNKETHPPPSGLKEKEPQREPRVRRGIP